ncbi:hypothetical protein RU06_16655 [Curtobacterium flaccumfaciens]|nr:hypothetical protein RU06_16655 [Curtobacterium flaccumfaciens]
MVAGAVTRQESFDDEGAEGDRGPIESIRPRNHPTVARVCSAPPVPAARVKRLVLSRCRARTMR